MKTEAVVGHSAAAAHITMNEALDMPKLRLVPRSPTLSFKANNLPQPFHLDPTDQIIVATARE